MSSIMANFAHVFQNQEQVVLKEKILFIINPKSGIHGKRNIPAVVEKHIDHNRFELFMEYTSHAGHATEIAASAVKNGFDVVVAVGGDGTVNEVARALVHTATALGVVPCGSGNGFARHIGIPVDVVKAIEFINKAQTVTVDYGKLNDNPFFCACGVGFDALVSADFANSTYRGMVSYVQKTLADWVDYEPETYEVVADLVKKRYKAFLIACGNASQYGNNAFITPFASMRDGLLSVSILEPFTPVEVPLIVGQLFSNQLDKNSRMTTLSAHKITIKRKKEGAVHYDGEPAMMDAVLKIEVVPDGLKVLAAPGWDGTCDPLPLYRQLLDAVTGTLPVSPMGLPKFK